jgi:signal transduction histidine kinase
VDVLIVLLLEMPTAASLVRGHGHPTWWLWVLDQALVLPLLLRRRFPVPVFFFIAAVALAQWTTGVPLVADVALLVALYTVTVQGSRRQTFLAAAVLELGVILASVRFAPTGHGVLGSLVFLTGMVAAALFIGTTVRTRREYLVSLEDRALRLERERDQQAELAATAERTRIAREMHDIVAHSLSVMIALADGAVATRVTDPGGSEGAMRQVAATGRQALAEMRRLLGVLREPRPPALAPQPTLDGLETLLDDVRAAGLPVRLMETGVRAPLPPTAEATAYRIVQESLTNVLKHAIDPTEVTVLLRWSPGGELVVSVTDDGRVQARVGAVNGSGHGLQGMRERAALFGGELVAGPCGAGGWRVQATLRAGGVQP